MKDSCNIHQLKRVGETSSDAIVYAFECNNELLVAKIQMNGPDLDEEYRLMKSLSATGIVPRVKTFQDNIIIMQHIPMTLARWLIVAQHDELLGIAANLVVKLKTFHRLGHLHGDLHANNILVNPNKGECYIIDFTRTRRDTSIPDDLESLQDSFYSFPLDMARDMYGYQSDEYYAIEEKVWFFEHMYVLYVKDIYDITLQQELQQQQDQEEA